MVALEWKEKEEEEGMEPIKLDGKVLADDICKHLKYRVDILKQVWGILLDNCDFR